MVRYGIVGLLASVPHFSISYYFERVLQVEPMIAHLYGFFVGLITAYTGHYFYSFNDTEQHRKRFPKFVITALTALVLHETGVYVLVNIYELEYSTLVLPLLVFTVPLITFLMSKFWVFSNSK
jgi:putative flippase GtrA